MKRFFLGIDEAGRGAVLGPLIVAGVLLKKECLEEVQAMGVKDSKKLTRKKREEIFESLKKKNFLFHFVVISPFEIDRNSINDLEIEASVKIIKKIAPSKEVRVFLDVPAFGKGIERYCDKLKARIPNFSGEIIGGNKMDGLHLPVGAASIVAKVIRDRKIEWLKKKYGDFGSGYPNERTIMFLGANYEKLRPIVREKWQTISKIRNPKQYLNPKF